MNLRHLATATTMAVVASSLLALAPLESLVGLSIDTLFWLRHAVYGPLRDPKTSHAVVIAIDEETYRRPPFADTPQAMWTPQIAQVLENVLGAGAKVIGFDIIYSTSVESFLRGYEQEFLVALRRGAQNDKIVLGRVQHQEKPIAPFRGYSFAVGHGRNIRPLNLLEDDDGIIRRLPTVFRNVTAGETLWENSLAVELAARALGVQAEPLADGRIRLGGYTAPDAGPNSLLINFDSGPGDIPSYSLADLHACRAQGNADYFRRHFADRVVLFGAVLDVEDRKLSSKRFVTAPEGMNLPERCALPAMAGLYKSDLRRDSIPGVYIHAAAVNNMLRRDALGLALPPERFALLLAAALLVAGLAMHFVPVRAAALLTLAAFAWAAICTVTFRNGMVLPLFEALAAGGLVFPLTLGYRFVVTDRNRRQLGRAFALYLPESVVKRLLASDRPPELGGELRQVSILFSDIANFTRMAERRDPVTLVQDLNEYFAAMTAVIEVRGGFVDKFVGDAVVAVFGAPLINSDHARQAVQAALEMQAVLRDGSGRFRFGGETPIGIRIGVNSGQALIGNIGSPRRFNYTVMGDEVNLASRIEGANKLYGTGTLVSEETQAACGQDILFREVDRVRVVGRARPVRLFEPIGPAAGPAPAERERIDAFAAALALWRSARFAEAEAAFAKLGATDGVARRFAERARRMAVSAPPADWDGTTDLTEK